MPAQFVKACNIRNKSDAADAKAIWLAVQEPYKAVAVKTEMQQAVLMMHRQREQLVKFRTMQINGLRGMLADFGEAMGKGRLALTKAIADAFIRIEERLPQVLIDSLREQWARIEKLDEEIARIERRLREWKKEDRAMKAISEIPGVDLRRAGVDQRLSFGQAIDGTGTPVIGEKRAAGPCATLRDLHQLLVERGLRGHSPDDFNTVREKRDGYKGRSVKSAVASQRLTR